MTDSVNWVAFFDPVSLLMSALRGLAALLGRSLLLRRRFLRRARRWRGAGLLRRGRLVRRRDGRLRIGGVRGRGRRSAVQAPVVLGLPHDALHVVLRLGERNVVDPLVGVDAGTLGDPARDAVLAR